MDDDELSVVSWTIVGYLQTEAKALRWLEGGYVRLCND